MRTVLTLCLILSHFSAVNGQDLSQLKKLWQEPTQEYRMKTWWFFGYEQTIDEGIKSDVEALRDAGFGGVVYYDQNHAKDAKAQGAEDAFSTEWWRHLRLAAAEAKRAGLSFELNISNGYCAGGRWIDPEHAMQRVASAEAIATMGSDGRWRYDWVGGETHRHDYGDAETMCLAAAANKGLTQGVEFAPKHGKVAKLVIL